MKKLCLILLLFVAQISSGLEPAMLNLKVPSGLEKNQLVFGIQHRFYGKLTENPFGTFFGLDAGANVGVNLRYSVWPRLDIYGSYTRWQKEFTLGAGYAYFIPRLFRSQINIEYFNYEKLGLPDTISKRRRNFFYSFLLQGEPVVNQIRPTVNVGYDGYNQRFGLGLGLDVGFELEIGPIEGMNIIGEYFPIINQDTMVTGPKNSFAAGIKLNTYGHHFMLFIGNKSEIGTRRLMLGTHTNDLFLSFKIHRFLSF